MEYDVIIGMEIHAELKTKSKMFCRCPLRPIEDEASNNDTNGKKPNTTVCPICMAHPGTLPVANQQAINWTVLLGLALNCQINQLSKFDRKNYFYPDLPKGYQISQYDIPLCYNGYLEINDEKIDITRIHLEEDTGKLTHPSGKTYTLADYNRAGTPLVELVTEPVIKDAETAKKFCQMYQQILRYLDISNADMEKGEMRCEANVSVQEKGKWKYNGNCEISPVGNHKLNPKVELKNINSFKAVEKAIDYEIKRQVQALKDGEKLVQETRGWNDNQNKTVSQRVKETSADYRYFPEPDIPPIKINDKQLKEIKAKLIELPPEKIKRFKEQYSLDEASAEILAGDKYLADYTEKVISELRAWIDSTGDNWERQKIKLAKTASNWLINELFSHLNKTETSPFKKYSRLTTTIRSLKITPENFAEFICLVYQEKINSSAAQTIFAQMYKDGGDPTNIMADLGLEQMDNKTELEEIIKNIISKNKKQVDEYKSGKENVLQFLVGQTMAATKGKANPKTAAEILKKLLK